MPAPKPGGGDGRAGDGGDRGDCGVGGSDGDCGGGLGEGGGGLGEGGGGLGEGIGGPAGATFTTTLCKLRQWLPTWQANRSVPSPATVAS